jgi:hypothetical protein
MVGVVGAGCGDWARVGKASRRRSGMRAGLVGLTGGFSGWVWGIEADLVGGWQPTGQRQKQIPFGNDKQRGNDKQGQRQQQQQIPFGNDKQRGNDKQGQRQQQIPCGNDKQRGNGNSRFPSGMTNKKATTSKWEGSTPNGRSYGAMAVPMGRWRRWGFRGRRRGRW